MVVNLKTMVVLTKTPKRRLIFPVEKTMALVRVALTQVMATTTPSHQDRSQYQAREGRDLIRHATHHRQPQEILQEKKTKNPQLSRAVATIPLANPRNPKNSPQQKNYLARPPREGRAFPRTQNPTGVPEKNRTSKKEGKLKLSKVWSVS